MASVRRTTALANGKLMLKFLFGRAGRKVNKFALFRLTPLRGEAYIRGSGAPSVYGVIARL